MESFESAVPAIFLSYAPTGEERRTCITCTYTPVLPTLFLSVAIKMQTRINMIDKTTKRKELKATEITNKY